MGERASSDKNISEIPMGCHGNLSSDTEDGARQPRTLRMEPGSLGRWGWSQAASDAEDGARQPQTLRMEPGSLRHWGWSQAASDTEDGARQPRTLRTEPGSLWRWVTSRNVIGSACVTLCVTQCQNLWPQMSRTLSLSASNIIIIESWRLWWGAWGLWCLSIVSVPHERVRC